MPPTERTSFACPQCQQAVEVELWQILDLDREPVLRQRFLQGQLNTMHCKHCGVAGQIGVPLVVHDPANERVIFFVPDDSRITSEIFQQIQRKLGHLLMGSLRDEPPDYIFHPTLCRDPSDLAQLLAASPVQSSGVLRTSELSDDLSPALAQILESLTPAQRENFLNILQIATDEESFNRELAHCPELLAALRQATSPDQVLFP